MTSQGPGLEILERLAEWSSEEIENNLDQIVQELLSHLSAEDKGNVLLSVNALFVTCLPSLPLEKADGCLLRYALPAAELLFNKSLEGIKLCLDDNAPSEFGDIADTLSSLLQVCVELLKCMDCVLQYIMSQGNVNISSIPDVPKTVALLMLQTFRHCKESEALYKDIFSAVADSLGTVFRQCHQVQCRFFGVITSNIKFDCSVETDILLLVDVLQVLSEIGEHVMSLDIKTMAEQWKGYAKIVQLYLEPLQDRLNIAYPLTFLSVEITNNVEQLINQESSRDAKGSSRLLKTTSFILKIVVKLCEQFGSGNGCLKDCHSTLYQLLLALHRYSPPLLATQVVERNIIDEIERHLIVAADPLLSHLICEGDFREEFFRKCGEVMNFSKDRSPHLLLMLSVMKKVGILSAEEKDFWIGDSKGKNIVGCLLDILKSCHSELSTEIWIPAIVKSGKAPRNCDLYEALCCHCAGLILSFNTDQFQRVEAMLIDSLLEPFIWPALFSADVWCICARAGSSELVLDQVLYFADIVSAFEPMNLSERTECKIIYLFLQRLCSFLGSKGKQMLVEKFPPSRHPFLWQLFRLESLPKEMMDSVSHALITSSVSSIQNFLSSNCSVIEFNKMIVSLCGLCAALKCSSSKKLSTDVQQYSIVPGVISLWQFVFHGDLAEHLCSSDHFIAGSKWLIRFINILCKCIKYLINAMSNKEILQIVNQLDGVLSHCNSSVKFSVISVLHSLATKTLEANSDQRLVCSKISNLFSCLLEDQNPIVKETALEIFEYFAHFTIHESIVADAVSDSTTIQEIVTSYLQRDTPVVKSTVNPLNQLDYLMSQGNVCCNHKCELKKTRAISPKSPEKPAKKICLEYNDSSDLSDFLADDLLSGFVEKEITEAVSRIVKDSEYLISNCSLQSLPSSSRNDLLKAVEGLNNLIKF